MTQSIEDILNDLDNLLPIELKPTYLEGACGTGRSYFSETIAASFEATLVFTTNQEAEDFAKQYSRKTLRGHIVIQNSVKVYNLSTDDKSWIDNYINVLNTFKESKMNEELTPKEEVDKYCSNCGEDENFTYIRTTASGYVEKGTKHYTCNNCGEELSFEEDL